MSKRIKTIVSIITSSLVVLNMGITTSLSCMAEDYALSAEISNSDIEETSYSVIPVLTTATEDSDEAVVTTTSVASPINNSNTTAVEYYGFSVKQSEINLSVGESCKIGVNFELPVYYKESLIFDSSNKKVASVSSDGIVNANSKGTAVLSISAKLDPEKVGLADDTDIVRTLKVSINVTTDKSLSVSQQVKLSELKEKGSLLTGEFIREEKVILEEFESDAIRITRDDVDAILSDAHNFRDIHNGLDAIVKYPDFIGGSGVTKVEYWLDKHGNEKILLLCEQEDVIYVNCSDKGNIVTWENLYSTDEKEVSTFPELVLFGTFKIYNNIDDSEVIMTETTKPLSTTITTTTTTTSNYEQQIMLSTIKEKGSLLTGEFIREEKVILEEFESDAIRITRDDIDVILSDVNSFQDVHDRLEAIAKYPDFFGGSGVTKIEYWLDEHGNEKILLLCEQEDVIYVKCSENGKIITWEKLYSSTEKEVFEFTDIVLVGSYKVYNNIDDSNIAITETTSSSSTTITTTTTTTVSPVTKKLISLNDIVRLSQKGEKLTWSDFEEYAFTDIGSGLYIWELQSENSKGKVLVSGNQIEDTPDNVVYVDENGNEYDMKKDNLSSLLNEDNSATTTTTAVTTTVTTTVADPGDTSESTNDLPQTGMPYARAVEGIAALLTLGGAALIIKSRKENDET